MGADRYYGGAIFETNVIGLDTGFSKLSDPSDQAFSFDLKGSSWHSNKGACTHAQECAESPVYDLGSLEVKAELQTPKMAFVLFVAVETAIKKPTILIWWVTDFIESLHKGRELDMYMPGYGQVLMMMNFSWWIMNCSVSIHRS